MKRRTIALAASGVGIVWPLAAHAQAMRVIGYLSGVSRGASEDRLAAFRAGLSQAGYSEGKNVAIEFRWADGHYDKLPALAAELVRLPVAVLVATGGPRAVLAAQAATSTIPIAFTIGGDPVKLGVVHSLSRPGGNATGISFLRADLMAKRFELLRDFAPRSRLVALMVNPNTPSADDQVKAAQGAANASGVRLHVARASTEGGIDTAFAALARLRPDALLIGTDAFFTARDKQFIALTARHSLPAIYEGRNAVVAGGLMSYGASITEAYAQAGAYAGRMLGGAKPADLPVLQPTRFELVINLKTAKSLGLTIPQTLLLRADEVIQ